MGHEYYIGRSDDCEIKLEAERGISRKHLRLYDNDGIWQIEVLSRFGECYINGQKVNSVDLQQNRNFEVPPYRFEFEPAEVVFQNNENSPQEVENALVSFDSSLIAESMNEQNNDQDLSDRTFVGSTPMLPYLKVFKKSGNQFEAIYRLDGGRWIVGRDPQATIRIDNLEVGLKQFEIKNEDGIFYICDLGYVNGTQVDQKILIPHKWAILNSGSKITIGDLRLQFELRDPAFESMIQEVPRDYLTPIDASSQAWGAVIEPQTGYYPPPQMKPPKSSGGKLLIYGIVGALVIGGAWFYQQEEARKQNAQKAAAPKVEKKSSNPFDNLSPEKQEYIRRSYALADTLFKQGRYEMARQEVIKIHQLIDFYEESRNIEQLAEVAIQTELDKQKAIEREQERLAIEEKIKQQVKVCRGLINDKVEPIQMDSCLAPVLALNPTHPEIEELKLKVGQIVADREIKKQKQNEYQALIRQRRTLFERAEKSAKNGRPEDAIEAYENFMKSDLPDPDQLEREAQRRITSIIDGISDKQSSFEVEGDRALSSGDLKNAVIGYRKAASINPKNEAIKSKYNNTLNDLRKQMQPIYQEGVLEESVGEVETAKTKWRRILDSSVPEEEYYKKSLIKLKKYGVL